MSKVGHRLFPCVCARACLRGASYEMCFFSSTLFIHRNDFPVYRNASPVLPERDHNLKRKNQLKWREGKVSLLPAQRHLPGRSSFHRNSKQPPGSYLWRRSCPDPDRRERESQPRNPVPVRTADLQPSEVGVGGERGARRWRRTRDTFGKPGGPNLR